MAGHEHQPQQVVTQIIFQRLTVIGRRQRRRMQLLAPLRMLLRHPLVLAQHINGTVARSGHQPGSGIVRDALLRPALQRGQPGVLGQLLGAADIAPEQPRQARDQHRRLHPPEGFQTLRQCGLEHASITARTPGPHKRRSSRFNYRLEAAPEHAFGVERHVLRAQ